MDGRVKRLIQLALRAAGLWLAINGLRCLLALRLVYLQAQRLAEKLLLGKR